MIQIESITTQSQSQLLDEARALFRAYGGFLRDSGGDALFCFSRLDQEIFDLPRAYTENQGEVLLAVDGSVGAGCVAYRSLASPVQLQACEIKRLFVSPAFRGHGVGKRLVMEALERARQNGFKTACLDTEPRSMASAKQMYLELGFTQDEERNSEAGRDIVVYFKKSLEPR